MASNNELSPRVPDPEDLTTVTGHTGTQYPCPDLAAVDQHIALLRQRIEDTPSCRRDVVRELWADIDLLLDRRMWLELTTLSAAS
ncbi:hypothetical protein [Amycolatopsis sp. FDAARGOS 1241]|uniref:hypothetical protein n=1 Tax=Amycolatopsis sp. FDAARGOS 1241 TaxID=2778070 RepID=UPI00194E0829|nr:hypothetical protein [Amycolatopsis sp. FDAARGOS 1241]QRP50337.1 hypothetical protein I6J71_23190 [Amycolatopsis sp. FDAARGOS 1241]